MNRAATRASANTARPSSSFLPTNSWPRALTRLWRLRHNTAKSRVSILAGSAPLRKKSVCRNMSHPAIETPLDCYIVVVSHRAGGKQLTDSVIVDIAIVIPSTTQFN